MTYEYQCEKCGHRFDVVKSHKDMDVNEFCPKCDAPAIRQFVPTRVHLMRTGVEHAEWNPALGAVVKNKKHREELAKQKGLIEVGNEPAEKLHKRFDTEREEKREQAYEQAFEEARQGDGR